MNTETANILLAAWLRDNYPNVYNELAIRAGVSPRDTQLGGFTDMLRTIGSGIATAAKSVASGLSTGVKTVGSFLSSANGQETFSALASAYAGINQATLATQLARAQSGMQPAVIETRYDAATNSYVPVYAPNANNAYAINSQVLSQLTPSFLQRYGMWIAVGGVGLVVVYFLMRRK